MKKEIKDYLHLYLGHDVLAFGERVKMIGIHESGVLMDGKYFNEGYYDFNDVKPILRPLSSMTEEEQDYVWHTEEPNSILKMDNGTKQRKVVLAPERTAYLLSKGFDIFNLIPEKLAVTAETFEAK